MTPISKIKQDLRTALQTAGSDVLIAFDYAAPPEASRAVIVDSLRISYEHQLDMGAYRTLSADLNLYAKTSAGLDSLIDAIASLDNVDTQSVRYLTLEYIQINSDDPDVKSATVTVSARIDEVDEV